MAVDSYLELFTTLFGWRLYNVLWDVLTETGLVYLPFLGILLDNWREPAESGGYDDGTRSGVSLRRMEIELFVALLVVVLAGQPASLTPLNAGSLTFTPTIAVPGETATTATVASPQSTYGANGFAGAHSLGPLRARALRGAEGASLARGRLAHRAGAHPGAGCSHGLSLDAGEALGHGGRQLPRALHHALRVATL
jgi:hypothetical protein